MRDAACTALGAIMKAIGKKSAGVLLKELENDKLKMAKVRATHQARVIQLTNYVADRRVLREG